MSTEQVEQARTELAVENVGGIDRTSVAFSPGVTILSGRNATNRTSLLQALMAGLGSDRVSIKGDAEEATVELTIDGETYRRRLERTNGGIATSGDPYLDDPTLADLFAFLLESNEARRAVARSDDLRELIMRPVDTAEIEAEIDRLLEERRDLDREIEAIESAKNRLPSLEEERTGLTSRIEETREELAATEADLEAADAELEQSRAEKDELDEKLSELDDRRSELEDVRYEIETERETLEQLRTERSRLADDLDELPETPAGELADLETQIDRLRTRKRGIESELNELQSIIGFNEEMLDEAAPDVVDALTDDGDGDVTDDLLADDSVTCWTCGTAVDRDQISATLDRLRDLSAETLGQVNELEDELDELTDRRSDLETQRRKRERIERRLAEIEAELESAEATLERLRERRDRLTDEVAEIEGTVEDLEDGSSDDVLDLHKEANQLEYELGRLESERDSVEEEIAAVESKIGRLEEVEQGRSEVQAEIEELRTRIDRIEREAIEGFNSHMETVLNLLDYGNLDRIWLESVERGDSNGRQSASESTFHLHVVRSTDSGTTYEDTVDHLSESEREVTGLVFTLAGYLAHDVYADVPFMLLDSLEAIDAERIAALVDYLSDHSEYLVVALLPEDAQALDDSYSRVTDI